MRRTAFIILLCIFLVSACGPRGPSATERSTQIAGATTPIRNATATREAEIVAQWTHIAEIVARWTSTPVSTPKHVRTATPFRKPTPTLVPVPTRTATPIELVSYQDDRLGVVFGYPPGWVQERFQLPEGEIPGRLVLRGGVAALHVAWGPPYPGLTLLEEAEVDLGYGHPDLVRSEPVTIGGVPGYLTERHPDNSDECVIGVVTRWEGYSYTFMWFGPTHDTTLGIFQKMLPSIRFVPTAATATPQPPTPTAALSWQQVATFQGSDMATTAPFDIQGDAWRVRWTATPRWEGDLPFDIYGFRVGQQPGQDIPIVFVMSSGRGGSDVNYAYTGPGAYYLVVNSAGFDWTIIVEDQY